MCTYGSYYRSWWCWQKLVCMRISIASEYVTVEKKHRVTTPVMWHNTSKSETHLQRCEKHKSYLICSQPSIFTQEKRAQIKNENFTIAHIYSLLMNRIPTPLLFYFLLFTCLLTNNSIYTWSCALINCQICRNAWKSFFSFITNVYSSLCSYLRLITNNTNLFTMLILSFKSNVLTLQLTVSPFN